MTKLEVRDCRYVDVSLPTYRYLRL